jgi:ribosome-binding protein aMBF1 (putative translation factor)
MAKTRSFRELSASARRDPARARRIAAAKRHAWEEHVDYRLADVRRALGLSQQELAELIGRSQSAVSQIESGEITLSVELLRQIVAQLGGSLEIAAVFGDRRVTLDA